MLQVVVSQVETSLDHPLIVSLGFEDFKLHLLTCLLPKYFPLMKTSVDFH